MTARRVAGTPGLRGKALRLRGGGGVGLCGGHLDCGGHQTQDNQGNKKR